MNRHKKITIERWTDSWKNSADDHYLNTSFPFGLPWVSKDVIFFGLQGMSVRQLHRTNKIFPENLHSKIQRTNNKGNKNRQNTSAGLLPFSVLHVFAMTSHFRLLKSKTKKSVNQSVLTVVVWFIVMTGNYSQTLHMQTTYVQTAIYYVETILVCLARD